MWSDLLMVTLENLSDDNVNFLIAQPINFYFFLAIMLAHVPPEI